ncbi:MAG: ABC transporter permease, partial [Candidatus Syntropharchaeia archaeon]
MSVSTALIVWELVADLVVRNYFVLPSPFLVFLSVYTLWNVILWDSVISLLHFGIGLFFGILVGVFVGSIAGWFRIADRIADPLIEILRPIPPLAWVPFAIVWFHLTHQAAGFIVFIGAVFPILINTHAGFRGIPRSIVDAARVLGCRNRNLMLKVALPYALPSIATGIRVGMGVGWMCVVAAEMFGVSMNGLGYRLFQIFYPHHQMAELMLYMLILG